MWNHKSPWYTNQSWEKKELKKIICPGFKIYYKKIVTQTAWHWPKVGSTDQWNRLKLRNKIFTYHWLIFNKSSQNSQWEKHDFFNKEIRNWMLQTKNEAEPLWNISKINHNILKIKSTTWSCKTTKPIWENKSSDTKMKKKTNGDKLKTNT